MKTKVIILARMFGLLALVQLAVLPVSAVTNTLQSVSPAAAPQGTNNLLVTFTLSSTPPPPAITVAAKSVTLGTIAGTSLTRPTTTTVTALFNIPGNEPVGSKDVTITFPGSFVASKVAGFTVTAATTLSAGFSASPTHGILPMAVNFTDNSTGTVTSRVWDFGDNSTSTEANPVHTYNSAGSYAVSLTVTGPLGSNVLTRAGYITVSTPPANGAYLVVDTGQTICYNDTSVISPPAAGQPFYGQDAQHPGHPPAYQNNGDGTITDLTTGLMWVRERGTKGTWEDARNNAAACHQGIVFSHSIHRCERHQHDQHGRFRLPDLGGK